MMVAYPNPAKDIVTLQFKNTESAELLPEQILLYSEKSTSALRTISVQNVFERKAFIDGNKIEVNVADLPFGVYFLHIIPNKKTTQKVEKIPILIE
ncbi:T9SS type A sorting domain-containing protein [Runella slithyformis]|uniref:Peptidase S8 and S53 subtilisin kexin sedolisin n=1 Tax=Runella slithyformis (strain ATCC 29530 / DSM 19594 / LMG 11500 / NCIMB 11436 / LSU 4) TaxID=761193 RepID=A0A7U3ZKC1_RUNSL|nr:T9SS type A sorting domain-containing protein [Runella slithyformis]AEI48756.1 peptidase S8 and S53 subtilisin kexin sedolisin [Runella slithyformis DSM 19594]